MRLLIAAALLTFVSVCPATEILQQCPDGKCPIIKQEEPTSLAHTFYLQALKIVTETEEANLKLAGDLGQRGMALLEAGVSQQEVGAFEKSFNKAGRSMQIGGAFSARAQVLSELGTDDNYIDAVRDLLRAKMFFDRATRLLKEVDAGLLKIESRVNPGTKT